MLFNSFEFLLLVAFTMLIYYTLRFSRFQIATLIGASLIFYGSSQLALLLLLLICLFINISASYLIMIGQPRRRKTYATMGVIFNISVLVFYKYGPLIVKTIPFDTGSLGALVVILPLPLGISFFTFHGITLLVDTLRARPEGESSHLTSDTFIEHASKVSLYFLFFPQLVAGPITKSRNFLPQIVPKKLQDADFEYSFRRMTLGYFLKMVIADNLAQQTFWISYPYFLGRPSGDLLAMLGGYSMQIFADFAGYSLIAIGVAALFGYKLPQNFNFPYISQSFAEFWTRWHMSLSSFLKEYLYFPLGGNRCGNLRTYFNLFMVMLLGGMWHGASWNFLVWGGAHGLALAAERLIGSKIHPPKALFLTILRIVFVFSFVSLAWLLFKLPDISRAADFLCTIYENWGMSLSVASCGIIAIYSSAVAAYHLIGVFRRRLTVFDRTSTAGWLYGSMLFLIVNNSGEPQSFVYFQF